MRRTHAIAAGAIATLGVLSFGGVAHAHHVYLDFTADGAQVPGGDPDGSATGTVDFNHEESDQLCLVSGTELLDGITSVQILNRTDDSVLVDFGASHNTCVTGTEEQFEQLHDFADEYRIVYFTQAYPDGAVAGLFQERPPTTTTSSSTPTSSTSTTAAPSTTAAAPATVSPAFTG